jgi:hypothetical protein
VEVSEVRPPPTVTPGPSRIEESSTGQALHPERDSEEHHMYATIRRYEGFDQDRAEELTRKVNESLLPHLSEMPGFKSYYLIEADKGVMSWICFFDTREQANESTRVAERWVREEKLETLLPNPPRVTDGEVIVERTKELVGV